MAAAGEITGKDVPRSRGCDALLPAVVGCIAVFCAAAAQAQDAPTGADDSEIVALHAQLTVEEQFHPAFASPYRGLQSLDPGARGDETVDLTGYFGFRPWQGAEIWINPEIDQGYGLSDTLGVDAFTSAEAYKIGHNYAYPKIQQFFIRETIDLGGETQKVDGDINQFAGSRTANRLVLWFGKMSVVDVFDTNKYANSSKTDFIDWALINTGTFDYAADAWGYTYGAAAEWYQGPWTLRAGVFDLSGVPNSKNLDKSFAQHEIDLELERRWVVFGRPGAVRSTGFLNDGRMAAFNDAVSLALAEGVIPTLAPARHYHARTGLSGDLEQEITDELGIFVRAGHADGRYEGFEFTDMANVLSAGLSLTGTRWGRKADTFGLGGVIDEASRDALNYFAAGGVGILAGDGRLPRTGQEKVIETYYSLPIAPLTHLTLQYQFVADPAFNPERGPVSIFGLRIHVQS